MLSSDSERARATAGALEAACRGAAVPDARLREIDLGGWQGLTAAQAQAAFPDEYAGWRDGLDVRRGSGETYAEVAVRAVNAVRGALSDVPAGGVLVAVTHGGTARALIGALLELPIETWWRLAPLGNARWSVLVEADRGWRLGQHNAGAEADVVGAVQISAADAEPVKSGAPEGV